MLLATGGIPGIKRQLGNALCGAPEVRVPEWQSMDVADKPMGVTHEVTNVVFKTAMEETIGDAVCECEPNLPWAEEHFLERVSGIPFNPPPSHVNWPYAQKGNEEHTKDQKFSHTYPERMWCKEMNDPDGGRPRRGIRFAYGDLEDVVDQLDDSPMTRQAYLPIWFPEDTGAVHGERVPCTLGYHFLIRQAALNVTYFIRSCDFLRHFSDDVYMAMRLAQWVRDCLAAREPDAGPYDMGTLSMHIVSLHVFGGDMPKMRREYE